MAGYGRLCNEVVLGFVIAVCVFICMMCLYLSIRCMIRVLDSFGTEPDFNHAAWAKEHNLKSPFGGLNLIPAQFYTMFRMCLLLLDLILYY